MELRAGYKKTEVGVIPNDWKVTKLSEVIEVNRSIRYGIVQPGKYEPVGCLMLRSQDYSKGWSNSDQMHRVNAELENQYKNARLNKDDLIMTVVGAGIGQVVITPDWLDKAIVSRSTARIAVDKTKAAKEYILSCLTSPLGVKQILDAQKEGAQPVISCLDLAKFNIPYPSIEEQTAIASALSDADALISSLEKLIAKKRNIKQGAMQKLLQPKEGWEVKKLGEIFTITAGGDLDTHNFSIIQDEKYCYPIYSNALTNKGLYGFTSEYRQNENTITVTARGQVGVANPRNHRYSAIGRVIMLNPLIELDINFISECINNFIEFNHESTGVPQLTAPQISKYEITIPDFIKQKEIATILSEMGNEINALETKLEKYRKVKLGMMQNLLTGKIRLV